MTGEERFHDVRRALRARDDVLVAIVFGSRARGDEKVESDLDLAVALRGADPFELAASLSLELGVEVDVVDLAQGNIPLLEEILRDGVVVHEGQAGAAALWRSRTLADLEIDRPWFRRMQDAWLKRVAEKGFG